jgi:hypothetical protein
MSFKLDLSKFTAKTEKKMEQVVKKTFISLSTSIIKDTPVAKGRLINNWFPAINKFSEATTDDVDKTGGLAIGLAVANANAFNIGDTITLSNNLPYAVGIEYGKSKEKAPKGMVRKNLIRFQQIVDRSAK